MKDYDVNLCLYGHLHAQKRKEAITGNYNEVELKLISCDHLDCNPVEINMKN